MCVYIFAAALANEPFEQMTEKNGKTIEMLKKIQLEEKDRRQVLGISDKGSFVRLAGVVCVRSAVCARVAFEKSNGVFLAETCRVARCVVCSTWLPPLSAVLGCAVVVTTRLSAHVASF